MQQLKNFLCVFLLVFGIITVSPKLPTAVYASAPTVTTGSATSATLSTGILTGSANANSELTTVWFDYGTVSAAYTGSSTTQSVSGASSTGVSSALSGLSPWVTYYYRIAGQNDSGTTYGSESSFLPRPQIAASNGFSLSLKPDGGCGRGV